MTVLKPVWKPVRQLGCTVRGNALRRRRVRRRAESGLLRESAERLPGGSISSVGVARPRGQNPGGCLVCGEVEQVEQGAPLSQPLLEAAPVSVSLLSPLALPSSSSLLLLWRSHQERPYQLTDGGHVGVPAANR